MIEVRNLWFKYGISEDYVLKNISFKFNGRALLVSGPNGSGKTTLLKIIGGLLKPARGEVLIEGNNLWKLKGREKLVFRRKIIYVHENPVLFKGTVLDNVIYPLRIRGFRKSEILSEVESVLRIFKLENLAYVNVKKLSAGQRKLVSLARAIISKPKYLLLDEPLATLDKENIENVLTVIKDYVLKYSNVIIASHRKISADFISKTIELENGSIVKII